MWLGAIALALLLILQGLFLAAFSIFYVHNLGNSSSTEISASIHCSFLSALAGAVQISVVQVTEVRRWVTDDTKVVTVHTSYPQES